MSGENELDAEIERMRASTVEVVNGETDVEKAMCSRGQDATVFGGWGA